MTPSIRELARHTTNESPVGTLGLRKALRLKDGGIRLSCITASFSVMTQNMGLMVFPAPYLGTDRNGAIEEVIVRIQELSPNVVGLCEVWANGEREQICNALAATHPYFVEGPDTRKLVSGGLLSDGGLLLLSKHPILDRHQIIYEDRAGVDSLANKGVLHIRIQPLGTPQPYDIFYTHAQDIEPEGGEAALYKQLSSMAAMIADRADPNHSVLIIGDLNIPGGDEHHYGELVRRLGNPVDFWTLAGNSPLSGFTFASDNNFYEDEKRNPHVNLRLDYVLMKPGLKFIPLLEKIEVMKFKRAGRYISDHFGLRAAFQQGFQVDF